MGGLAMVNFWVCQSAGKTFYVSADGMMLEKNFRQLKPLPYITMNGSEIDISSFFVDEDGAS